jgi:hypothetical protein
MKIATTILAAILILAAPNMAAAQCRGGKCGARDRQPARTAAKAVGKLFRRCK